MIALALVTLLAAEASPRLLGTEASAQLGVLGTGYSQTGIRLGDAHLTVAAEGRWLAWRGVMVEGGLLVATPFASETTATALTPALSVGWVGERWQVSVGASFQWAVGTRPAVQPLPMVRAAVDFGPIGAQLGLFDRFGLVPLHVGVFKRFGDVRGELSFVALYGALAAVEVPVARGLSIRAQGFVFKFAQAELAMFSVGVGYGGER